MGIILTDNLKLTLLDGEKLRILGKCDKVLKINNIKHSDNCNLFFLKTNFLVNFIQKNDSRNNSKDNSDDFLDKYLTCKDYAYECKKLRKQGFCDNKRYHKLVMRHCKATCGFCPTTTNIVF